LCIIVSVKAWTQEWSPKRVLRLVLITCTLSLGTQSRAEEGGTGHYEPGQAASLIDALPGDPGIGYIDDFVYYHGSGGASQTLPVSGRLATNFKMTAFMDPTWYIWETPLKVLRGNYSVGLNNSYELLSTEATLTTGGSSVHKRDTANGNNDLLFVPAWIGWTQGDFKCDVRFGIYAPTGTYSKKNLANIGKNYLTFEPEVSLSYLCTKTGLEASAFAGLDFNTKNYATDYRTGDEFHLDVTVAEHVPLGHAGYFGVGATAWYYQQITGDSGTAATLGSFESSTSGVGPAISYFIRPAKEVQFVVEAKWLPDLHVENRIRGDVVWLKAGVHILF
jgi:hypothetical protein